MGRPAGWADPGAFVRIVSLFPAATEIACALGLADELVGVGHPSAGVPELAGVRLVTRPEPGRATVRTGGQIVEIDDVAPPGGGVPVE